jgi:hypothetical protein
MHVDDEMDGVLRRAMSAEAPRMSPGFEADVLRRVRPRRLTRAGRVVMAAYAIGAVVATAWLLRGLDPIVIALGVTAGVALSAGAGVYAQHLLVRD